MISHPSAPGRRFEVGAGKPALGGLPAPIAKGPLIC